MQRGDLMEIRNIAISVSLGCIVSIVTTFATFSYNQGTQDEKTANMVNRITTVEQTVNAVNQLGGSIDLLRQEVGFMRDEFSELKEQTNRMSQDMKAVNLYIAKQEGAQEAMERIGAANNGNR